MRGTRARVVQSVSGGTPGGMMASNTFWSAGGWGAATGSTRVAGAVMARLPGRSTERDSLSCSVGSNQVEDEVHHRRVAAPATLRSVGVVHEDVVLPPWIVEDVEERGPVHSEMLGDCEGGRRLEIDRGASGAVPRLEIVTALRQERRRRVDAPTTNRCGPGAPRRDPLARIERSGDPRFAGRVVLRGAVAAARLRSAEQIAGGQVV